MLHQIRQQKFLMKPKKATEERTWFVEEITDLPILNFYRIRNQFIGKKHAITKYDQFALNTSCFCGTTGSNITPQLCCTNFTKIFVTKK